jgi:ATP-dependent RNA helicase RhlE
MKINKGDYEDTIRFSEEAPNDNWQLLIDQHNEEMAKLGKKKKKKK